MFIEKFIKKVYISFYKDSKYKFYLEIKKNKKLLSNEKKEFETEDELTKEINSILEDYTQVYISTVLTSINQGIVPSCNKSEYKKMKIDLENIKYICIKNKYSFYISLYDLMNIKKQYSFDIDFLYSLFAPIDFFAKKRNNYFYVLILEEKIAVLGYKNDIPIFADIIEFNEQEDIDNTEQEDIELLEDIDLDIDEISENIEEEAQNLDVEENTQNLALTSIEHNIIKNLQNTIKEYYTNYSDDFLEKIIYLDTINIGKDLKKLTEDELLLESDIISFDLNKILNILSEIENV